MIQFLSFLLILFAWAAVPEKVSFSRYITIKTCYDGHDKCIGPTVKEIEKANVELKLSPTKVINAETFEARDHNQVIEDRIPINSEIRILKNDKEGPQKYKVYMRIKSGNQAAKIKEFYLEDISQLKEVDLTDSPIRIKGGTVQAQLVIEPKLPLDQKKQ